jgi:hypothetical protein
MMNNGMSRNDGKDRGEYLPEKIRRQIPVASVTDDADDDAFIDFLR